VCRAHNTRLQRIVDRINQDDELYMLWRCANVNAATARMSDHGRCMCRSSPTLRSSCSVCWSGTASSRRSSPSTRRERRRRGGGRARGAAARRGHGDSSRRPRALQPDPRHAQLRELLDGVYDLAARTVMLAEVLHAIIAHRSDGRPLTLEAGIVRVATRWTWPRAAHASRSSWPGQHPLALGGGDRPYRDPAGEQQASADRREMLNSAGVFQLDALLKEKLSGSGLEPYVEVIATIQGEAEKKLIEVFRV